MIADHLGIDLQRNGHSVRTNRRNTSRSEVTTDPDLSDRVYRALVELISLTNEDRQCLRNRGLDDETIDCNGYATLDVGAGQQVAQDVLERVGCKQEELITVPGFVRENGSVKLTAWLGPGILIPCRGLDGLIRAIKVRRQQLRGNQAKYVSLSGGRKHEQNAGAHCHVPVGTPSTCETVRVTEGELKSDISFALSELPTIGVPGISPWRTALPVIEQLGAQHVLIAYDAPEYDDNSKPTARDAAAFARELLSRGFDVEIETWRAEAGKGIDDVMAAGNETSAMTLDGLLSLRPDLVDSRACNAAQRNGRGVPAESDRSSDRTASGFRGAVVETFANIERERVEWLWQGKIPVGMLTVLSGNPGLGKSLVISDIVARVTKGQEWPDGRRAFGPADVLLMNFEDPVAAMQVPRLDAAGADSGRVHRVRCVETEIDGELQERSFLAHVVDSIRDVARQFPDLKLVVLDPLSVMLQGVRSNEAGEVRGVLTPLVDLAEELGLVIVLVHHNRKGSGTHSSERLSGSLQIGATVRQAWEIVKDADDPDRRLMLPGKSNNSRDSNGLAFRIVDSDIPLSDDGDFVGRVQWDADAVYMTADDHAVNSGSPDNSDPWPVEWLRDYIGDGTVSSRQAELDAKDEGISQKQLRTARNKLGIKPRKSDFEGGWVWELPTKMPKSV